MALDVIIIIIIIIEEVMPVPLNECVADVSFLPFHRSSSLLSDFDVG